ncbi:NUDIX domain-containing protein [Candidatus Saccharibacteria bacterium]|nr:MAG: NUDIX domain-containing protein [Candidatus Saccharibacteria bacterium]
MHIIAETLAVVDRPNPETGELEILMGQPLRNEFSKYFNFPGGGAERGELLDDAAVRELREETGVALTTDQLTRIGSLITYDLRPHKLRFGTVAIYGAHLDYDPPLTPKAGEFDCFWVNPKDRNILLNMPPDVPRWLPLVYREPFVPFICVKTVDDTGGSHFTTGLRLPGQNYEPVDSFARNL